MQYCCSVLKVVMQYCCSALKVVMQYYYSALKLVMQYCCIAVKKIPAGHLVLGGGFIFYIRQDFGIFFKYVEPQNNFYNIHRKTVIVTEVVNFNHRAIKPSKDNPMVALVYHVRYWCSNKYLIWSSTKSNYLKISWWISDEDNLCNLEAGLAVELLVYCAVHSV